MTISEITIEDVKQYLRVDGNDDDKLIGAILKAAITRCERYTGCSFEQLAEHDDVPLAVLALCADMYDVRQATLTGTQLNPTTMGILNGYSKNLL